MAIPGSTATASDSALLTHEVDRSNDQVWIVLVRSLLSARGFE
ncbi:hypothetical protein [Leptolyngbya sp. FACHB-541]|nr:hypothetical protein [Leptolyngbya sp. FACHB-541]